MPTNPDVKTNPWSISKIIVAGDVCIDWLSILVDSHVPKQDSPPPMNWQLRGGRHMYARRGGAWLTADFVEAAVGDSATVLKPAEEKLSLANIPPEDVIHSMLTLRPSDRQRNKENVPYWVVTHFDGYAGPANAGDLKVIPAGQDDRDAQLVLLDDAGNGFRDSEAAWPLAIKDDRCKPLVLYKVRRPLAKGQLWERLKALHLDRTIALLSADELRGEGGSISGGLSWEHTATDLILSLAYEPRFAALRGCQFLIIPLAIEGAVLVRCVEGEVRGAHLWYVPNLTEVELLRSGHGEMSGFGSALAATLTSALVQTLTMKDKSLEDALHAGISDGLAVMHRLLETAFGPCEMTDPKDASRQTRRPPEYPGKEIFEASGPDTSSIFDVPLPNPPTTRSSKAISEFRSWRILDSKREKVFTDLAADVVRRGVDKVFTDIPMGQFGKFVTLDRLEIESYRGIRSLIREFLNNPARERPLCLGVFGPPGGGKSFGVGEVARNLDKEGRIAKLDFNVSQWNSPDGLVNALHRVRDYALLGKVPLVFFDEFDSQFGSQKLGWLKYFLAPMQDGVFGDGAFTHEIGKAIFVFAGGTAATFSEFNAQARRVERQVEAPAEPSESQNQSLPDGVSSEKENTRNAKLLDFVSRLRGNVDVFGLNGPVDTNLLRRALILRSNIQKKYPTLIDSSGAVRIDDGVLRAILHVPRYYHGARSLEAILDMSHLLGRTHFDPSRLPPQRQLNLHVEGDAFMALVQQQQILGARLEEIAKEIHELFLNEELTKKDNNLKPLFKIGDRQALRHWKELDELYKKSNREQAAHYPTLLATAGCGFEEMKFEKDHLAKRNADKGFEFSSDEIERLARMEHDRFIQERRLKQPDHPDLVPWEELNHEEKEKDIRTIKAIPKILGKVGLRVVRLS